MKIRDALLLPVLFLFNLSLIAEDYTKMPLDGVRRAAEAGDADAQYALGESYNTGSKIKKDGSKARFWYRKAALQGNLQAWMALGDKSIPRPDAVSPNQNQAVDSQKSESATQSHPQSKKIYPTNSPISIGEAVVTAEIKRWDPDRYENRLPFAQLEMLADRMSNFMLKRKNNDFVASSEIPSADAKGFTKGSLIRSTTLRADGGGVVKETVLSGLVWTPRVSNIGDLDLVGYFKITESADFNFETFKASPEVIPFTNGYAVNLFGQKLDEGGWIDWDAMPKGNYVSERSGRPLYGHLVRMRAGKLEEIIIDQAGGNKRDPVNLRGNVPLMVPLPR